MIFSRYNDDIPMLLSYILIWLTDGQLISRFATRNVNKNQPLYGLFGYIFIANFTIIDSFFMYFSVASCVVDMGYRE